MRHVSRTHRVSLDWLFDRISLDPKIQIRYIDTKHQMADKLAKGHFTRDEWNNLLHLFNISHFSSLRCAKNPVCWAASPKGWRKDARTERRKQDCGKIKAIFTRRYEKVHASPRPPPKISFKHNWMNELGSEVAGGGKDSQQTQSKTKSNCKNRKTCLGRATIRFECSEIDKRVLLLCESTNVRTGRSFDSCVPVSVERFDQDKDARRKRRRRSNKSGESREWTTNGFVHAARGNRH